MKSEKAYYFNNFKYLRSKLITRRSQVQILAPPPNQIKGLRETVTSCPPMPLYLSRTPSSIPLCRVFSSEAAPALPFPTLRDRDPTSARRSTRRKVVLQVRMPRSSRFPFPFRRPLTLHRRSGKRLRSSNFEKWTHNGSPLLRLCRRTTETE